MGKPIILDACCSGRSFWFDKNDCRAVFMDKRVGAYPIDVGTEHTEGRSPVVVNPNVQASFTSLPFRDKTFYHVVYDPPHVRRLGENSFLCKKYGRLEGDWEFELQTGFLECFRVLKPNGTLIFKWSDVDIPISKVLRLINQKPLYGHKSGKASKTHWVAFIK